jgi:type I restriction enzyme S subunit
MESEKQGAKQRSELDNTSETAQAAQTNQPAPRPSYKHTELGEIPKDWDVGCLDDFILALEAGISVNSVESMDAFGHGKSILKTSCVSGGYFLPSEGKGIMPCDVSRAKMNPKKGSIIISRMNTPALVGEIGYVDNDYQDFYLPDRLWQTKFKPSAKLHTRWLAYILSFPSIAKKIKETATGTSDSMKNISKPSLLAINFPCPQLEEQTAIANFLSDMDTELDALQQRLSKTQKIKQGMMQELLTGKTRLV